MYIVDLIEEYVNGARWCGVIIPDAETPKTICIIEGNLEHKIRDRIYNNLEAISKDVTMLSVFPGTIDNVRDCSKHFKRKGFKVNKDFDYKLLTLLEDAVIDSTDDYIECEFKNKKRDNRADLEALQAFLN